MAIDPLKSKPTAAETGEASRAARPAAARHGSAHAADKSKQSADSVELSAGARESTASTGPVSSSGLTGSRIKEVVDRVNSGFYDTDGVRDTVARRIQNEGSTPGE